MTRATLLETIRRLRIQLAPQLPSANPVTVGATEPMPVGQSETMANMVSVPVSVRASETIANMPSEIRIIRVQCTVSVEAHIDMKRKSTPTTDKEETQCSSSGNDEDGVIEIMWRKRFDGYLGQHDGTEQEEITGATEPGRGGNRDGSNFPEEQMMQRTPEVPSTLMSHIP